MTTTRPRPPAAFAWNAGGWFGSQIGATVWMLLLGGFLAPIDPTAAMTCVGGFVALNLWGLYLWRGRGRLYAYVGIMRFLAAASVATAVAVVVDRHGPAVPPPPAAVSAYLPYGPTAVGPALMAMIFLINRRIGSRTAS